MIMMIVILFISISNIAFILYYGMKSRSMKSPEQVATINSIVSWRQPSVGMTLLLLMPCYKKGVATSTPKRCTIPIIYTFPNNISHDEEISTFLCHYILIAIVLNIDITLH